MYSNYESQFDITRCQLTLNAALHRISRALDPSGSTHSKLTGELDTAPAIIRSRVEINNPLFGASCSIFFSSGTYPNYLSFVTPKLIIYQVYSSPFRPFRCLSHSISKYWCLSHFLDQFLTSKFSHATANLFTNFLYSCRLTKLKREYSIHKLSFKRFRTACPLQRSSLNQTTNPMRPNANAPCKLSRDSQYNTEFRRILSGVLAQLSLSKDSKSNTRLEGKAGTSN